MAQFLYALTLPNITTSVTTHFESASDGGHIEHLMQKL